MEIQIEPEPCKRKDMTMGQLPVESTSLREDSGYLSQSQSSILSDTTSVDLHPSASGSLHSSVHGAGISTPLNSMILNDFSPLESNFLMPPPKTFLRPSDVSGEVHQSTPFSKRLRVDVHKEFDFVTPLPGPSCTTSNNLFTFVGQNYVDIPSLLSQCRALPPLHQILSYLEPAELCQLRLVSSSWRKLLNNFPHVKVWQEFVKVRQQNKENSLLNIAKQEEDLLVTPVSARSQLRDIHNFVLVPTKQSSHSPPVSPSKMHSSRYFKEGQKLKSGEKLRKCPKCAWPSRADSNKAGIRCTGRFCGFHFCMDCSGPFHDNTPCATAPVTPTKARNRGTKLNNKKKLYRLLF